jgi:hypothetical protein
VEWGNGAADQTKIKIEIEDGVDLSCKFCYNKPMGSKPQSVPAASLNAPCPEVI